MKFMHNSAIFAVFTFAMLLSASAYATDVDTIVENIRSSSSGLSGLAAAFAYLTGSLFAVLGVMKTIDHVTTPSQTPLRKPVNRFLVGGGLFALPTVIEAAYRTFNGDGAETIFDYSDATAPFAVLLANAAFSGFASLGMNFNSILYWISESIELLPGFIAMLAYILAILMVISGLLKIRDHVDEPERTGIREPVIRLLIAGALLALPTIYDAMYTTIANDGVDGSATGLTLFTNILGAGYATTELTGVDTIPCLLTSSNTLGGVICQLRNNTILMPVFLTLVSYILGLALGFWGLFKIRDHVLEPSKTPLNEGVTRLLAGGAFFALPFIATTLSGSLLSPTLAFFHSGLAPMSATNTGFAGTPTLACAAFNSLDMAMSCLMSNTFGPLHVALNFFCIVAGMIFIMIGISRIIRSSQEGARGPGGRGTVATFIVAGILLSANALMRAMSSSLFGSVVTTTNANLKYTTGMDPLEVLATYNVISAVLKFMIIIGLISFVRGIFIMRDVAEGNQQASTMSGITHILGGALAVNLGPLLNAIQTTLGITTFGVTFT